MAYKQLGGIDFSEGQLKYFIKYCPDCKKKILLERRELSEFSHKVEKTNLTKVILYECFLRVLDKINNLFKIRIKVIRTENLTTNFADDNIKISEKIAH
jgi:tmRNA-binding protein